MPFVLLSGSQRLDDYWFGIRSNRMDVLAINVGLTKKVPCKTDDKAVRHHKNSYPAR